MSVGRQQNISEATAQKIDAEVRRLVDEGYQTARRILTEKSDAFKTVAEALLEYETLTGDEIKDLIAGKRPVREPTDEPPAPRSSPVPSTTNKPRPPRAEPGGLEPQPSA
jgi:cell division protease FtsH